MEVASRFTYFWLPKGTVSFTPPARLLMLSDYIPRGGVVEILALLQAERTGNEILDLPNMQGAIVDPASDLALDQQNSAIDRINTSPAQFILFQTGGTAWSAGFEGAGDYIDATIYIQTSPTRVVVLPVETTLDDAGFSFLRFDVPAADRAALTGIASGDRFIVALESVVRTSTQTLRWPGDTLINWPGDVAIDWPGL